MKIYIGADHNGYEMKGELRKWLTEQRYEVTDMGALAYKKEDDYPDFGIKVAEAVAQDAKENFGILICASGVGMSVVADKVPGIRAALIHDPKIAEVAQRDDDINVLALGARFISLAQAKKVITNWLSTPFSLADRHQRRLGKIAAYENGRHGISG